LFSPFFSVGADGYHLDTGRLKIRQLAIQVAQVFAANRAMKAPIKNDQGELFGRLIRQFPGSAPDERNLKRWDRLAWKQGC
jgi:hypothetical protein